MLISSRERLTVKKIFERIRGGCDLKNKACLLLALFNVCAYAFFSSQIPISINYLINTMRENQKSLFYLLLFICYFFISRVTRELQLLIFGPLSQRLLKVLSLKSFKNIISQQDGRTNSNKNLGRLTQIINNGENSFIILVERLYYLVFPLFLELSVSTILLFINFGIKYSVVFFCVVISYLSSVLWLTNLVRPLHRLAMNETLTTRSKIHDYLKNKQLVNNYHIHNVVSKRLSQQLDSQNNKFLTFFRRRFFTGFVQSGVLVLGVGIINYIALIDYQRSAINIGFFAAINLYILQFIKPFEELGLALREMRFSLNNLYLYIRSTLTAKSASPSEERFSKRISTIGMNGIHFEINDRKILTDISLHLRQGEKIVIVGKTGEGKSTLCKILGGMLKPSKGYIEINGKALSHHDQVKDYRILYVSQETQLFDDNIDFNIFLNYERVEKTIKETILKEYCNFFDHNDVGQNVSALSGGQKQLVTFLRAIAHKPDVILFDEVNSSQDLKSYCQIVNHILNLKDTAVIFVTHRIEMIENFDKTYVIRNKSLRPLDGLRLRDNNKINLSLIMEDL